MGELKVYALWRRSEHEDDLFGLFSTKEKAQKKIEEMKIRHNVMGITFNPDEYIITEESVK